MKDGAPKTPDVQQPEKPAVIHIELAMAKKASYVRAAQRDGKKLVPWILEKLDTAAKNGN